MRALRSFAVRVPLPEPLAVLERIARNLRWAWNARAVELFRWVDPDAWEAARHDPVHMLGLVTPERFDELSEDGPFMAFLAGVEEDLVSYLEEPRWFQSRPGVGLDCVAYFSPEFGVSEALPNYSGGLGVLAGDHLKAASDLGIPLVGVGLFYREGYFRQQLATDGWQQEHYPSLDPHRMPLSLLRDEAGRPLKVGVDLAGSPCTAQLWAAQVGRVRLLLLDCDIEDNAPDERVVTNRLYAGASEHRLRQEIVLGIGGTRALDVAGYKPDVWHSNEGHAGFLGLERIRRVVVEAGLPFEEALEAVRAGTVFTTHTPVPAGIDRFDVSLIEKYFSGFVAECGIGLDRLLELGDATPSADDPEGESPKFNMAVMGIRLAAKANGVSKLHGDVSRHLFADLWPHVPVDERPITSVTNGVHTSTWLGPEMAEILDRRLQPGWQETGGSWERVQEVPDAELWRARERARDRLVYFVRARARSQLLARGASVGDLDWTEEIFDPAALTIGFARRFAEYKRATLLLSDPTRLIRLLTSTDRPIQIVMAGKAHPLDDIGKAMIRAIVNFASDPEIRGRFTFIEDYDIEVARNLVQGCDVWLNTPLRPLEASGTSGMKAVLNGCLNASVLDGWWDEVYDRTNGWSIGAVENFDDRAYQDKVDVDSLYEVLEHEIIQRFYDRDEGGVPRRWIERVKRSMSSLGPFVTADRMVRDYVEELYEPICMHSRELSADGYARAKELSGWKRSLAEAWPEVRIEHVEGDVTEADVGEERKVAALVHLGSLHPGDVDVQLAHGRIGANLELREPEITSLIPDAPEGETCMYRGTLKVGAAGLYGFTVRVVPHHRDLIEPLELGLVAWPA